MIEINAWVVVASIPALRPLVHDVYIKMSSSRQGSLTLVPSKEQTTRRTQRGSRRKLRAFWGKSAEGSREDFAQRGAGAGEGAQGYKVHVEAGQAASGWTPVGARRSNSALGTRSGEYGNERYRNPDVEMGKLPGIRVDTEVYVGP